MSDKPSTKTAVAENIISVPRFIQPERDLYIYLYKSPPMTAAAKSIFYFSIYIYLTGITLIFIPNIFLKTIGLQETNEVWIRVAGVLVFLIAFYYHRSAAANTVSFFKLTIPARFFVLIAFIAFSLLRFVSPVLIVFGIIDALGAVWTWLALRKAN